MPFPVRKKAKPPLPQIKTVTDPKLAARAVSEAMRKRYGKQSTLVLGDGGSLAEVTEVIPTGISVVDSYALGIGGLAVGRISELYGPEGVGKASSLSSLVLTPNGFRMIGDLRPGDVISDPMTGKTQTVTHVFPQGEREVFEVEVTDGGKMYCCAEHLFRVHTSNDTKREGRVLSLGEIMQKGLREKHGKWDTWKWRLPQLAPIEFVPVSLPLDPYLLGLLLGDGSFSGSTIAFCKPEPDLWDAIARVVPVGDSFTPHADGRGGSIVSEIGKGGQRSLTAQALSNLGLEGCRSWEKFIPEEYLAGSAHDRMQLLRGLIDTDGSVVGGGGTVIEFSTASPHLASAIPFLVRSLGGLCVASERTPTYSYKGETLIGRLAYRFHIRFQDACPVSSKKHLARWGERKQPVYRSIVAVRSIGVEECVCIRVSGEHHLYVADDFIVTHNSSFLAKCIASAQRGGGIAVLAENENALQPDWWERVHGVDLDKIVVIEADTIEQTSGRLYDAMSSLPSKLPGPSFFAWDTVASTPTMREIQEGLEGTDKVGDRSKSLSKMMRLFTRLVPRRRCHFMILNQIRDNVGVMFGDKTTTPGGHAIKFHSSVRLQLLGGKKVTEKGSSLREEDDEDEDDEEGASKIIEHAGKDITLLVAKNKLAIPWRKARLRLSYHTGWDDDWSTLYHAKECGFIAAGDRGAEAVREAREKLGWTTEEDEEPPL